MTKTQHEVRDGIHGFISFNNTERKLIDSRPFQRLRAIHQLALCQQVYPGASHKRFEHSLGVMEVASRIFESLFLTRRQEKLSQAVRDRIAEELEKLDYWRSVLRIAALLHDVGHLPFSHAAEKDLLPQGWNHERITAKIIRESEIGSILLEANPPIRPDDVVDLAWDLEKRPRTASLGPWKTLLNEIITGPTFGADRIDYLLRDSLHCGVAYGKFDPIRLIDGLRATIDPDSEEIAIGLDWGSIHAAEALLLARYFMYRQVYLHDVRRIYDIHLKEFLQRWLPDGRFPVDWKQLMDFTDHEIFVALYKGAEDVNDSCHVEASRLVRREHFRTVYELMPTHKRKYPPIFEEMVEFAIDEFGAENVRADPYFSASDKNEFWVLPETGGPEKARQVSHVIANLPDVDIGFIFVAPHLRDKARTGLDEKLRSIFPDRGEG